MCRQEGQRGGGIYLAVGPQHRVNKVVTGKEYIVAGVQVRGGWVVVATVYIPPRNSRYERKYEGVLAEIIEAM